MARVHLVHWDPADGRARCASLALPRTLRLAPRDPVVPPDAFYAGRTLTQLDGNVVREAGLAAGFVDFKVCRIDATWSGLAFKRRTR